VQKLSATEDCTRLVELRQQLKKTEQQVDRLKAKLEDTYTAGRKLVAAIHREEIKVLIGKPVKRKYRSHSNPQLNDVVGILTDVRRTRCSINFGDHGNWTFPIEDVAAVDQEQGFEIMIGGAA